MLNWVTTAIEKAGVGHISLVLGPDTAPFNDFLLEHPQYDVCIQEKQQGTADAVASAACVYKFVQSPSYNSSRLLTKGQKVADYVLVTASDTPAVDAMLLRDFIDGFLKSGRELGVIGMHLDDPRGYGRLVCDKNSGVLQRCVEEKDADPEVKAIKLCNSGIIAAKVDFLFGALAEIAPHNAQNEYYLTDVFWIAASRGSPAYVFQTAAAHTFNGVNDRFQLAQIERSMLLARLEAWALQGISFRNLGSQYIECDVCIEPECDIGASVVLTGKTHVHRNAKVGALAVLHDVVVGAGAVIAPGARLTACKIRPGERVT